MALRVWHGKAWHGVGAQGIAAEQEDTSTVLPMIYQEGQIWNPTSAIAAVTGDTRDQSNVRITLFRT